MNAKVWDDTVRRCSVEVAIRAGSLGVKNKRVNNAAFEFFEEVDYGLRIGIPSNRTWEWWAEVRYKAGRILKGW